MLHIAIPVYYGSYYESRKPCLYQNLKFLEQVGCPIFVLAQEWRIEWVEDFWSSFPNIQLFVYPKKLGISGSRNETIKKCLYDTDADFMYTFDADQVICNLYGIIELFKIIHTNPQVIPVDMIKSGFVEIEGFRKFNIDNRELVEKNFTLHNNGALGGTNYFVRNFKKFYDKEVYYQELINNEYVFEDIYFTLSLLQNGYKVKQCQQLWCYTPKGFKESTIEKPKESNLSGNKRTKRIWLELQGFTPDEFNKVMQRIRPREKFEIPRLTSYTLTEHELNYKPRRKTSYVENH